MMDMPVTTVDFLRHGACEGGEIFRGSTDVALSEEGWAQMRAATTETVAWDHIYSSPLIRCRRFAGELAVQRQLPIETDERLREMHFGVWEGREIAEVWENDKDGVKAFFKDPEVGVPEGGEPLSAVAERLLSLWDELLAQHKGEHLLLVQHGGTIRSFLGALLGMSLNSAIGMDVPYASVSRLKVFHRGDDARVVMVYHNRGVHQLL